MNVKVIFEVLSFWIFGVVDCFVRVVCVESVHDIYIYIYIYIYIKSRTNLVRSHGGVLDTLGHSKRRETRGDACEDEARGRWAVRPRTGGGRGDGFPLFFDKPSCLRDA